MKRIAIAMVAMILSTGCQKMGRQLFGVEEREVPIQVPASAEQTLVDLSTVPDPNYFRLFIFNANGARYVTAKIGDGGTTWVPMPFSNPKTGAEAIFVQDDRGLFTFYHVKDAAPNAQVVRVEIVR